jgi:hypothetical protein
MEYFDENAETCWIAPTSREPQSTAVWRCDTEGKQLQRYDTLDQAAGDVSGKRDGVVKALRNPGDTYKGWLWRRE